MSNKGEKIMKKTLLVLSIPLLTSALFAKTVTEIDLGNTPYTQGASENEYGDKIMYQDVTINTKNFKIDNLWSKFSDNSENQSNFSDVATAAQVQLTTELSFTCRDAGLSEQGCSGQKPFLINQGTLNNPDLKLDRMGAPLPTGEYRIPFDSATNYDTTHDDAFYALDVYRDGKYYENPKDDDYTQPKPKTFFGYMISLIKNYFSPKNTTTIVNPLTSSETEARNRYMANITFGLQQNYRIKKASTINTDRTNDALTSKQPSLLDYNSMMINNTTGCDGIFFTYNPDSLTCKFQNFFGMSQWMPFFGSGASLLGENDTGTNIQSDSVLEDTETTLLALEGKLNNKNYVHPKIDPSTGKVSLLGQVFKPMTYMMSSMFRFFFGESSKNLTETVAVDFNFTKPMPLTFIEVKNKVAQGFKYFQLLGLESVYGTEVQECKVKKTSTIFFFFSWTSDTKDFQEGVVTDTPFDMSGGYFHQSDPNQYSELNVTTSTTYSKFDFLRLNPITKDTVHLSTNDWLNWCKRNQGKQQKGLFGRIFSAFNNTISYVLFGSPQSKTYADQVDKILKDADWSVLSYKEKVHKGLILHLKEMQISDINSSVAGTTTTYKIMKISRGHQKGHKQ